MEYKYIWQFSAYKSLISLYREKEVYIEHMTTLLT
jgi:hypothetical protein